jgi:hypothetical protein
MAMARTRHSRVAFDFHSAESTGPVPLHKNTVDVTAALWTAVAVSYNLSPDRLKVSDPQFRFHSSLGPRPDRDSTGALAESTGKCMN